MNILLVGGSCSLMDSMILKLRKEGHRVFLLTGDKYRHNKYERVFEKYDFITADGTNNSIAADIFNRGLCLPSDIKNTEDDMKLIISTVRRCFNK